MTIDEKYTQMAVMLGEELDTCVMSVYLSQAKQLILNKRFPYGEQPEKIEAKYDFLQIELAIVLLNERGVEGQSSHNENGVARSWRSKDEILSEVVPYCEVL